MTDFKVKNGWRNLSTQRGTISVGVPGSEGSVGTPLFQQTRMDGGHNHVNGKHKTRLVLADDSSVLRKAMLQVLLKMGFLVVGEASNGREAVQLVQEMAPDLLILDIEMPVMDGITTTHLLRQARLPVKILILSNYTDKILVRELIGMGVDGYMVKEDAPSKLTEAISTLIDQNRSWYSASVSN